MILGIEINDVKRDEIYISKITTTPDNPYFKTDDRAVAKRTNKWSDIKDGDFILIENELMEGFTDSVLKVTFNKDSVTISPVSSFLPHKEKEFTFEELKGVKLSGKIIGIFRGLSKEFVTEKVFLPKKE